MSHLATVLKQLMLKENLTESELARRTGIGQPVIHRISSGETDNPKIDTLLPIADYFALDLSELAGDHPLPKNKTNDQITGRNLANWQKIPLLDWEQIKHWLEHKQPLHPLRNIGTHHQLSPQAYAVTLADDSLLPRFSVGTIFVVEPLAKRRAGCFCVVLRNGCDSPVIYEYQKNKEENGLYAPLNPDFGSHTVSDDQSSTCMGVAVQVIYE